MSKRLASPANCRAQGPIRMLQRSLPSELRDGCSGPRFFDLGQFRGRPIPLSVEAVATLFSSSKKSIKWLINEGVLKEFLPAQPSRIRYVLIDPALDMGDFYKSWVQDLPAPATHTEFQRYRKVRSLCHVWAGELHPEAVLEGVFRKLLEMGTFNRQEVNGLIPIDVSTFGEISAWLKRRAGEFARKRNSISTEFPVTLDLLKAALPEELTRLRKTCFDPGNPYGYEPPSRRVRHRLWRLNRLLPAASLYALVRAARIRRPDQLGVHISVIERVEEIMNTFAPDRQWTSEVYREALHAYAVAKTILPDDVPAVRDLTVRYWRMIVRKMHLYAQQHDPSGLLGLRKLLPPRVAIRRETLQAMTESYGGLRQEGKARRKDDSHEAFAELDRILAAAENRRDEMRELGRALRAEEDAILPGEAARRIEVDLPCLDERGELTGGMQRTVLRLWRTQDAWETLRGAASRRSPLGHALFLIDRGRRYEGLVVEYVTTESIDGSETRPCWMIGLAMLGTFVCPAELPAQLHEPRHEAIVRNNLPGYVGHGAGLLGFSTSNAALARCGAAVGRHFIPLAEMEHAIRLAHVGLDGVAQSLRRAQELQQLIRLDWKRVDVLPDKVHMQQLTIPKVPKGKPLASVEKVPVTLLEASVDEILDLCELQVRRCGYAEFPTMQPARPLRWKCPPAEYVLSHEGRALLRSEINLFLRYLLAGWPPFTLHDFRHAGAEEAEFEDEPTGVTQDALGHADPETTRDYRKLSADAATRKEDEAERRRMRRLDERARGQ